MSDRMFRSLWSGVFLAALAGCIEGGSRTTVNFGGTYRFITEQVDLGCQEKSTGVAISLSPLPRQEFTVEVTQDGSDILLYSTEFDWNMINMRVNAAADAGNTGGLTGKIASDGSFYAETTSVWTGNGDAGPMEITQRLEGWFTGEGVSGTYFVKLFIINYNTECQGNSGFTGEKIS